MNTNLENKVRKVERVSGWLRLLSLFAMVGAGLFGSAAVVVVLLGIGKIQVESLSVEASTLSVGSRLVIAVVLALAVAVTVFCCYQFRALMGLYRSREFFSQAVAQRIRLLGIGSMVQWVLGFAIFVAVRAVSQNPNATVSLAFSPFLLGAVFVVISWFVEMAAELRQENDLTI